MKLKVNLAFYLLVTLTLRLGSCNIDKDTSGYLMHLSTKFQVKSSSGLGGVWHHTDTNTHRQRTLTPYAINNILECRSQ